MAIPPHTILIVDDEAPNRRLFEALLRPQGYRTRTAINGEEALLSVEEQAPDLILLNVMMPGLNGYEVAKALKRNPQTATIPIIMVTAQTGQRTLLEGLKAGAEEFLTKPINKTELWLRVRNLLRLKELRDFVEHENERLEEEVRARTATLQRFKTAMDVTADAIFVVDVESGAFVEVNATASTMFGYAREEFLGLGSLRLEATTEVELERLRDAILGGPFCSSLSEAKIRRKDGIQLPVEIHRQAPLVGEDPVTVGVVRDITERQEAHLRLYQMAHHDALTGLPNRTLFQKTLEKTLAQAKERNWVVIVLHIDLDHFKTVNDTHGHATGDILLGQIGDRLLQCVRVRDTVGRLGGDEFAVILISEDRRKGVTSVARKIGAALREPFTLAGAEVHVTASIGISSYPEDASEPDVLIKYADTAMYQAKQNGRDAHCTFTPQMNVQMLTQLSLESALHKALEEEQFIIHYQPKVSLTDGRITGLEALLRWERPGHGLVPPKAFIEALEETGLIIPVGSWAISTVCRQIKHWSTSSIGPRRVSVNVSGRQFVDHDLDGDVGRALLESSIDPSLIELELTESSLMQNTEATIATLLALKDRGVELSIDDFGTGYSSLAYLQRFPIDKVKIDIAFVRNITADTGESTIAQTIIQLAHSLQMRAIAEGVETAEQLAYLRHNRCDEMQGYLFSRPLPLREVEELLREERSLVLPLLPSVEREKSGAVNEMSVR